MKILVYSLNYSPELTGVGKFTGEMGEDLASHGHEVRVICAPPYYPEWARKPGFRYCWWSRDVIGSVVVYRCPIFIPSRQSGLLRALHLLSFAISSLPVLLYQIFWRPRFIWMAMPTFLNIPAGIFFARLVGAKTWLHIQDFEVDAAVATGLFRNGLLARLARFVETRIYAGVDHVSTISDGMAAFFRKSKLPGKAVSLIPNWFDFAGFECIAEDDPRVAVYRAEFGFPIDRILALYSGNIGNKQGLELVIEAAQRCPDIFFVICGSGSERQRLQEMSAMLTNVVWLDLQPVDSYRRLLLCANIHLMTQLPSAHDLVMPSKLNALMASGRCTLLTALPDTDLYVTGSRGGVPVPYGDIDAIKAALDRLAALPDQRRQLGMAGREFVLQHFSRAEVTRRLHLEMCDAEKIRD